VFASWHRNIWYSYLRWRMQMSWMQLSRHKQRKQWKRERTTSRWYFFWSCWRKIPVYVEHNHQLNTRPSPIKTDAPGSTPWNIAVRIASAMPPSTQTAWQVQGVVHGISSLRAWTFRPNSTQGQNSPVQPNKARRSDTLEVQKYLRI
jgi:hypothetical protein